MQRAEEPCQDNPSLGAPRLPPSPRQNVFIIEYVLKYQLLRCARGWYHHTGLPRNTSRRSDVEPYV